jgi:hypothetical protein
VHWCIRPVSAPPWGQQIGGDRFELCCSRQSVAKELDTAQLLQIVAILEQDRAQFLPQRWQPGRGLGAIGQKFGQSHSKQIGEQTLG